jgi:hypothetical protein
MGCTLLGLEGHQEIMKELQIPQLVEFIEKRRRNCREQDPPPQKKRTFIEM